MIKGIIFKELYQVFSKTSYLLVWVVIIIIMILCSLIHLRHYTSEMGNFEDIKKKNNEILRVDSSRDIYNDDEETSQENTLVDLAFVEQNLTVNPSNLAFISEAEEYLLPNGIKISYFTKSNPVFNNKDITDSQGISFDWRNILIYFISFLCICFAYDSFSGEREKGTLKLLMANRISKIHFLIGKFLGLWLVLLIPILIGIFFSIILIQLFPSLSFTMDDYYRILIFVFATTIYIALNILLCMLISSLAHNSSISLSFCLLSWIFFIIIIPNIGWILARNISPVSTIAELNRLEKNTRKQIVDPNFRWNWHWSWEDKAPVKGVLQRADYRIKLNDLHNGIWENYRESLFKQTNKAILFSYISPYSVFRFLCEKVSNNGFSEYRNFYAQVDAYQTEFQNFIRQKDDSDPKSYHLIWDEYYFTRHFMSNANIEYNEIPKFHCTQYLKTLDDFALYDFFILTLWCLVLFIFLATSAMKYDVR